MRTCSEIRLAGTWDPASAADAVVLDFDARHRRRFAMAGEAGVAFLLDLPRTTLLRDGDGLVLADGAVVRVKAAPERLIEVTASNLPALVRIAWHLGNRHLPTQLLKDRLRLREDHVAREMIEGLGGVIAAIEAPFDPEGGAFDHRVVGVHARVPHRDRRSHASIDLRETRAPGFALTPSDLIRLQTWFAASFPVGAFTYSHGLEWAVEAGDVSSAASLREWIESIIRYGASRSDAIVLCTTWRAASCENWNQVREIGALAAALQPSAERRLESLGQGAAFLTVLMAVWPHPRLEYFRTICADEVAFPVVAGAAGAAHGLRLDAVLIAYLHAFAANLVSAGVRLVPLGQTNGLKVTAALESVITEAAHEAYAAKFEDLGSAGILADIASMRHETQYSRLFRS